jgi:hypothetical protein
MKQSLILLGAIGLTAAFTYLIVANHFNRERAARLAEDLARVEAERTQLEEDLRQAQAQARMRLEASTTSVQTHSGSTQVNARLIPPPGTVPVRPPQPMPATAGAVPETGGGGLGGVVVVPVVEPVSGPAWTRYTTIANRGGNRCVVQGTSSLAAWNLEGKIIVGYLALDPRLNLSWSAATILGTLGSNIAAQAEVAIPVRSLKSQVTLGSATMDRAVSDRLSDQSHKEITYHLKELIFRNSPEANHETLHFDSRGEIEIRGVTNAVEMLVTFERLSVSRLKISGATALKMSDFNIKPPAQKIGGELIEVGDDVVVSFDWVVERSDTVAAAR